MASEKSFMKIKITDAVDRGGIESLPGDILVDIFSRLPISSVAQLMLVRKSWRSIITQRSRIFSSSPTKPCLLLHCDFPLRNVLRFLDLSEEEKHIKTKKFTLRFVSSMPEFEVVGSCNGLLCLSDSLFNDSVYLYNPFTTNSLELPECSNKYQYQELVFGFGFHEKTKEYKVVKIVYFRGRGGRIHYKKSEVKVLTLPSRTDQSFSWRSLGKAPYKFMQRSSEALVNGRLHFVTRPSRRYYPKFVSFDLEDEEFREISKPDCGGLNRVNLRLVSLNGRLCAVVNGNYGRVDIWVMKSYGVKESWEKEYSIRNYLPERLKQNLNRPEWWLWKNPEEWDGNAVRVLCALENDEILLEYKCRALVAYDPIVGTFKDLLFHGLPNWFHTVVHVGTLTWFDTPLS